MWYLILFVVGYAFYRVAIVPYFYWKIRGVEHETPLPYFGNYWSVMVNKKNIVDYNIEAYRKFENKRCFGNFQLTVPTLYIRDLDIIKEMCVKHFDHFMNHRSMGSTDDPLFYKNLIALKDEEWRQMRAFLTPAFTSGKVKRMWPLIEPCIDHVIKHCLNINKRHMEIELKDLVMRYANDVITTCAFGVECNSLENPNNLFFETGKDVTNFPKFRTLKMFIRNFSPRIARYLNIKMFSCKRSTFFLDLIKETISHRESKSKFRPDVINLLLEARKKIDRQDAVDSVVEGCNTSQEVRLENMSDIDIAAQCFIFYITGFDTITTVICFALTELAINPDIQAKLFSEINDILDANCTKINYDVIMKMKYLDTIVLGLCYAVCKSIFIKIVETLRKWPPAPSLDRACTKDFTIAPTKPDEKAVHLKSGDLITIPIIGIHRDAKYFKDPDRFDPERFCDKQKDSITPYSYLPFGLGPRQCIASRFALLEIKGFMVKFLREFEVTVVKKTSSPIVLTKASLKLGQAPANGFWIGIKHRRCIGESKI